MKHNAEAYVYIMTNKPRGVLYTGVTSNLARRVAQHKTHALGGFTAKYNATRLAYCEASARMDDAIAREKQIKGWKRERMIQLIEGANPDWRDLAEEDSSVAPLPQNDGDTALPQNVEYKISSRQSGGEPYISNATFGERT